MKKQVINHWAIWAAIIIAQLIPAAYYRFFGDQWIEPEKYLANDSMAAPEYGPFVIGFIAIMACMYILGWIFPRMDIDSGREGAILGLLLGIAFYAIPYIVIYLFSSRGIELAVLGAGMNTLVFALAGLIIGGWRKYEAVSE